MMDLRTELDALMSRLPPPAAERESFAVFSGIKMGSTLLFGIMANAAKLAGVPYFNPGDFLAQCGIPVNLVTDEFDDALARDGFCFVGFHGIPRYLKPEHHRGRRKIILVRDPRDALTSYYFSIAYSHPIPPPPLGDNLLARRRAALENGIDRFCREYARPLKVQYQSLMAIEGEDTKVFRYEDVIFRKREWILEMIDWVSLPLATTQVDDIVKRYDIRPSQERPQDHIRSVAPGNFQKHLTADTIAWIGTAFAAEMAHYGYDAASPAGQPLPTSR